MQFLKILFWVALAVILVLFAQVNWTVVTLQLWGGLEADVKLPILVLFSFLLGFVPMLIVHKARVWSLKRRLDAHVRQAAALATPAPTSPAVPATAPAPPHPPEDRFDTDQKVWPA